jgi:hypothetical protein
MEIAGLLLNFIGCVILALSTGKFFKWIDLSVNAHEIFIQTFLSNGNVVNLANTTKHLSDSFDASKKWMVLGVFLVALGFVFQAIGLFVN